MELLRFHRRAKVFMLDNRSANRLVSVSLRTGELLPGQFKEANEYQA